MEENKYYLKITYDEIDYSFFLTLNELMRLVVMPYENEEAESNIKHSHIRLDEAKMDAYRLDEEFFITYENKDTRTILIDKKYSEIVLILKNSIDKIKNNTFEDSICI